MICPVATRLIYVCAVSNKQENSWSRALVKNAIVAQLVNNSRPVFGTLRIFTATVRCPATSHLYRGADKSLARPTSRCVLFDGENISFDASLVIYIYI